VLVAVRHRRNCAPSCSLTRIIRRCTVR